MVHAPLSGDTGRVTRPHVVADANIPFLEELLGNTVRLTRLPGQAIDRYALTDADALLTRTRTRCDARLLDGTPVRFIGTATIGTDHIDFDYCHRAGIEAVSAPGCNAPAVAQYVWSSILRLTRNLDPGDVTVGIVGVGHVGRIVEAWGRSMGYRVLCCDPPRAIAEGPGAFVTLETIARECDVITFHTPYTTTGPYLTHHLAGRNFLERLERHPVIINSARGPITDTPALLQAMDKGLIGPVVIDCWEGEPAINMELLERAEIATSHIAGYSIEGKQRASFMVARELASRFGLPFDPAIKIPGNPPSRVTPSQILESYDPYNDTVALRGAPDTFEALRNHYHLRREPAN